MIVMKQIKNCGELEDINKELNVPSPKELHNREDFMNNIE